MLFVARSLAPSYALPLSSKRFAGRWLWRFLLLPLAASISISLGLSSVSAATAVAALPLALFGYIRNVLLLLQLVAFETLSSFVMLAKHFNGIQAKFYCNLCVPMPLCFVCKSKN